MEEKNSKRNIQSRLQTWEKALDLCNTALKLKTLDEQDTQEEDTQYYEDVSQEWQLSHHDQGLIIPTNTDEAMRVLRDFRPSQNTPATLQTILSTRADPNIIVGSNGMTPLHNIVAFARRAHVRDMRRLLLDAGATESDDVKERWEIRCRADASDDGWLANFHQEPSLVPSMNHESQ